MATETKSPVLLPTNVVPTKYTVCLNVDLENFSFDGEQTVDLDVSESESKSITLHSRELHIKTASFQATGGDVSQSVVVATAINYNLAQQPDNSAFSVTFVFADALPVGQGILSLTYTGCLNNQMAGFYRSGYTAINGEKRIMASTQFEALDARRCIPCWDEPAIKAVFELSLIVGSDLTAFSNMPETRVTQLAPEGAKPSKKKISFMPTPKMSTYLVAFCVGEFDFVQGYTEHGVQVRVYTPPGKSATGEFSLQVAMDTLDLYDDYFQVPYPLPKLDMVAIPEFAAGAMENWGLVTYREVDLLIDAAKASSTQRQRVCSVVTHELAHQWFGNLVTMRWWDDLWLNEGFASWMQTYAADKLFPSWMMWEQFTTDDQAAALRLDALVTSHPIQVPIAHAEEVEEVFDMISYCKGASVIRMIHAILGPDAFRRGLQIYFQRHAYDNTVTTQLWDAWSTASGKPVAEIMASWTNQMGFPLLAVEEDTEHEKLLVSQSWFLADGSTPEGEPKLWTVPVLVSVAGGVTPFLNELQDGASATYTVTAGDAWVKVNSGQELPLRVLYSAPMLAKLLVGLADKSLPAADRAGVVGDYSALAKAGKVSLMDLMNVLEATATGEESYTVWEALETAINGLAKVLVEIPDLHQHLATKAGMWASAAFTKPSVGWEASSSDGHLGTMLRGLLIRVLGEHGAGPEVVAEARRRFELLVEDPGNNAILPSDYKTPVFKIVLRDGGEKEYEQLMQLLAAADDNAERKYVFSALGAAPSAALKQRTLDWTISGEIKLQDFFYPMGGVSGSGKLGSDLAFAFFKANFQKLKTMLAAASPSLMNAVIVYTCGASACAARADEVEAFMEANPMPAQSRKVAQLLEGIRTNATFVRRIQAEQPQFAQAQA